MSRRSKSWDESLAKRLWRNPKGRRHFYEGLLEEGYEPMEAVSTTIKAMGIKEYAEEIGMDSGNLYKHLNNRGNLTLKTIKRILKPLGLGPGIVPSNETNKAV